MHFAYMHFVKKGLTFRERKYNPRVKLSVKRFSVEFVAEGIEIEMPANEEKINALERKNTSLIKCASGKI